MLEDRGGVVDLGVMEALSPYDSMESIAVLEQLECFYIFIRQ
jgi:hypothetical protein